MHHNASHSTFLGFLKFPQKRSTQLAPTSSPPPSARSRNRPTLEEFHKAASNCDIIYFTGRVTTTPFSSILNPKGGSKKKTPNTRH